MSIEVGLGQQEGNLVDQAQFERLYGEWYKPLVRYCSRRLCGAGDPEAVAQEAFARAWASWDLYRADRPFWPWLATIARRLCIDHQRSAARYELATKAAFSLVERGAPEPAEHVELEEEGRSAMLAYGHLKPGERRVVALRDIDGWTYEEIASLEGVTVESVRGALKRARASLRHAYARVSGGTAALALFPVRSLIRARRRATREIAARVGPPGPVLQVSMSMESLPGAIVAIATLVLSAGAGSGIPLPTTQSSGDTASVSPILGRDGTPGSDPPATRATQTAEHDGRASADMSPPPGGLLPGDGARTPEDAVFEQVVRAPGDRSLVFGIATVRAGCPTVTCPALFRSADGGATWERTPADRFLGGELLIPGDYPKDPRLFAAGPSGLQLSLDHGRSFQLVSPIIGPTTISPAFSSGDPRLIVGTAPGWEYDAAVRVTRPAGLVLPNGATTGRFAFSPRFADDRSVFVGGTLPAASGPQTATVFACQERQCLASSPLQGGVGVPIVEAGPIRSDGTFNIYAWLPDGLYVSGDRGRTFDVLKAPTQGVVNLVHVDRHDRVWVSLRDPEGGGEAGLFRSVDHGRRWHRVGEHTALGHGAATLATDGAALLAAPVAEAGGGLLCSVDDGATWTPRCAS